MSSAAEGARHSRPVQIASGNKERVGADDKQTYPAATMRHA